MTLFLFLLIVGYIVAFVYTLTTSFKNSKRLAAVETELTNLKAQIATGGVPITAPEPEDPWLGAEEEDAPRPQTEQEPEAELPIAAQAVAEEETSATIPARPKDSFESKLGARWAVWVGGIALGLGGILLVKYSIESGLLSPAVRLAMAAIFGLLLMAAGEAIRRKAVPGIAASYSNAMIPGVLTAAGVLTLFGVVYAAYGIYEYIGPTFAFVALALVAFATLGLSLLHGQALAGLGLFGSMVTPALISTETPNIWALFGFLTISWLATAAAARRQRWTVVPSLANTGLGLWALGYIFASTTVQAEPVIFSLLAMIAGTIWIWPGNRFDLEHHNAVVPSADEGQARSESDNERRAIRVLHLLARSPLAITLTVSLAAALPAIAFIISGAGLSIHPTFAMAAIIIALAALGASRNFAVWPAIFAALTAQAGISILGQIALDFVPVLGTAPSISLPATSVGSTGDIAAALLLGAIFAVFGLTFIARKGAQDEGFAKLWAVIVALFPVWIGVTSFATFGNLSRDWLHAAYGLALGLTLLASAEWLHRKDNNAYTWPLNALIIGSFAAFALTIHALTEGLATTLLLPILGFGYVLATRYRPWPALPWVMAIACGFVLGRIAWEPTIVGPQNLGTTPVFNALLPGYGIPAVLAIASAWLLRNWPGVRAKNFLQAIASLMGLLAIAILIRHAMNGGVLNDAQPTLGEQSIYTLLTIGMSGVLMTLDLKSPSPVFRYGSMLAGVIAMFNVLVAHFFGLNPYFTGENTGPWPFLNLLLIGYLLPAIAYGGLAWYARGKRPALYVTLLALSGAALGFAWATLSVRRFWQGENIADWKGFLQGETYSYSVVWLAIGVLLLLLGSRFNAKSLRLASAVLVFLAVAKAFLIDMSNLEGVLRALSFIGLGAVLIGIGLFYQKILTAQPKAEA